jgi:hypothetical protein
MMRLFTKKQPTMPTMPTRAFSKEFLREKWWEVMVECLRMAVDDSDGLARCGRDSVKYSGNARAIADAAIAEFEDRWSE